MTSQTGVRVYQVTDEQNASQGELKYASSAPAFLELFLGPAFQRRRLFQRRINWDRIVFISVDGELAGYLQFYLKGKGPHQPLFSDMRDEYGAAGALWRFPLYYLLEKRFKRFKRCEAYLYRVIVKDSFRAQGLGRQLVEQWLVMMNDQGIKIVELEVWGNNTKAQSLYSSLGFGVVARHSLPFQGRGFQNGKLIRMARKQ